MLLFFMSMRCENIDIKFFVIMVINFDLLLVLCLVASGHVETQGATISQNLDLPTQNDTSVNLTIPQPTSTNSSKGENTGNTVQISEGNMLPILETSDAGSQLATLVRRHGDFDNLDEQRQTSVPQKGARRGKETRVSQKEAPVLEKFSAKNIYTRVMSTESLDESGCQAKTKGPLMRLYGNSKYFADSENKYKYAQAKDLCNDFGLVLAELESIIDHRTVQFFVGQYRVVEKCSKKFLIGANDIEMEGVFTQSDGKELMFQNFHLSQPDDQNQDEDCVALMKEVAGGPVGSADVDCNTAANVLCMFPFGTECYKESRETQESIKLIKSPGLISIMNITGARGYFVSNFQLTWNKAIRYCLKKNMTLFNLDEDVTMQFFETLVKWEMGFVQASAPPLQYWTSGRFKGSHMNAEILWHTKPLDTSSSDEFEVDSPPTLRSNFSWSGVYRWSTKKGADPGGPHGFRRDVCVSFGFEAQANPSIRNTNCELPAFFVCSQKLETVKAKNDD